MFRKRKIILIHLALFIILTLLLLFTSEPILNRVATEIHNVGTWLDVMIFGTIGILILTITSCLIFLRKNPKKEKKRRIEKIELIEKGFQIYYDEEITTFYWSEIDRLTGFKVDRYTIDDICLKIESNNKTGYATAQYQGWRNFMNKVLTEFPLIVKNWEIVIVKSAFENDEMELYYRNKKNAG